MRVRIGGLIREHETVAGVGVGVPEPYKLIWSMMFGPYIIAVENPEAPSPPSAGLAPECK
jgi:hypothetical protein